MGLYSDMMRQTYGDPADSYTQPTGMTSDQAVDRYRYASLNGVDPRDVTQEMIDRYKAEKVFEGTGPVFQEKMQNPVFKAAVQGQEKQVASVEQSLMGISSKDSNITTKAFARGAADLVQVKNGFSAYQLRNEIDTIKQELKAKPDDPRLKERLDIKYREAKKLAESIADYARISKAFNEGSYKQKVESGDYDALDMLGSIWEAIVQSMTTNAPALAGTAVATATLPVSGTAAVLGAGAGLTALGSGSIDYALGLVGKMSESGIDVTDAESVKYYLTDDSRFHENQMGSARHAAAVGAFDAASFVIGGKAARSALEGVRPGVPVTAALLMNAQKNGVAKTIGHGIVQGQIQGLMGAAGEATGQILDTGEITDTMGIFYEYAAEVGMSPVETTIAAYGAQRDAAIRARRAEFNKQVLAATTEAARTTPALQESDEIRDMYLQEIEAAHPEFGHITVDLNSLHQSHPDVIDSIIAALPDKEAEIRKELALGGAVELSLDEYARITKEEEAAQAILDSTSLADDQTVLDAQAAEKDIAESRKFAINRFAQGQSKEWFDDYMGVAARVNDVLKTEKGSRDTTERSALLSLTLSHIANMAKDAGMLSSEVWNTYGINAVLRGGEATYDENGNIVAQDGVDIVRDKDNKWVAVSEKGNKALANGVTPQAATNSLHQGALGEFIPSTNTIIRWANADRSTLLHETGHWFLKARVDLAVQLKAQGNLTEQQQHLVDSIEKTVKWLGAKDLESFAAMDLDSSRDMQEKFATTYEQYLKDGHAPNHGLMTIFRKFSGWLRRVYGTLAQVPGSQMTPDVKELFDNLFVSHEQVREAQLRRNLFLALDSIPRNPNDAITHSAAAKALNAVFRDIDDAAVENYNSRGTKVIGYVRRLHDRVFTDLTKQAKKIRAQIENEETMRVLGPQRAEAIRRISEGIPTLSKAGQLRHVKPQIYIKELIALGATTEEIAALRAQGLVTDTNGVHATDPQVFATFTGYSSLDAFIDDFGTDPFEGKKPDEFVKDIVDQRIYDEHPELADKESIADTADAAVFNPTAASVMAMEINFLEGANGRPVSMDLFKAVAEAEIRHKKVKDLSAYKFRQAAERLGRRARALLSEGNLKGAASVKRQQLVQTQKAIRAQELKDQTEKFVKTMLDNFRGEKTSNSMQLDYLKQVSSILASIGVIPDGLQNTPTWAEFCTAESGYTFLPQMPNVVASGKQFDEMTATEAIETMEFMRDLIAAARERNSVIVGERKESLELIDAEQAAAIEKNAADKGLKPVPQNERNHDRSLRVQHAIREFKYNHARFHTLWAVFEGTKFGTFFERFGKRIDAARDRANELKYEKTKAYYEAMQKLKAAITDRKEHHYRTLGGSFDKEQMISIALNIGNDSNFERLLDGSDKYVDFRDKVPGQELSKWTRQDVLTAISEALTFDELSTIQEIWNICGSLGDELQALDARTRNKQVDKVEPKAVTLQTADGKAIALAGGYFPVSYDKYGSNFESGANFVEGLTQSMPQGTRNSDTGHSIERNRLNGNPIALTPNAGYETLNDIINDICYREVLVDLNKLIAPKTKTRHAIQTYFGKEAITEIQNWMNDVASGGKSIPSNKWENLIRKNVSIAGLGFNLVTALLQPLGMTQSAAVVGGKWCAKGMIELFSNPPRSVQTIMAKSSMMRSRMRTRFKELSEVQTQFDGTKNSFQDWMGRAAFKPIVIMQMTTVDMPTWLGAYRRFLEEGKGKGLSGAELEDFAVGRADRSVIDAQGSGDLADLARVERKKSIWNVFYSFFGTVLNACVVSGKTEKGVERAMSLLLILGVQPVIESFLRAGIDAAAGDPDDYDEILMKRLPADLVSFPMGMFVYGREFSPAVAKAMGNNPYDYSGPAGTRTFSDAVKLGAQIYQGEIDKGLVKATANFSADLLGLPATELSRIVDTIDAIDRGKDVTPLNFLFGYKGK